MTEAEIIAEMSRIHWCRDRARLMELGRMRAALRESMAARLHK